MIFIISSSTSIIILFPFYHHSMRALVTIPDPQLGLPSSMHCRHHQHEHEHHHHQHPEYTATAEITKRSAHEFPCQSGVHLLLQLLEASFLCVQPSPAQVVADSWSVAVKKPWLFLFRALGFWTSGALLLKREIYWHPTSFTELRPLAKTIISAVS